MPKKPIASVLDDQPDAIDDDTFAELDVDEERLHASLKNLQSIHTGEATNIAKTKSRQSVLTQGSASAQDDVVDTGAAKDPTTSEIPDDGAQSH